MGYSRKLNSTHLDTIVRHFTKQFEDKNLPKLKDMSYSLYQEALSITGLDEVMDQFPADKFKMLYMDSEVTDLHLRVNYEDNSRDGYYRDLGVDLIGLPPIKPLVCFKDYSWKYISKDVVKSVGGSDFDFDVFLEHCFDLNNCLNEYYDKRRKIKDSILCDLKGKTFTYIKKNWREAYDLVSSYDGGTLAVWDDKLSNLKSIVGDICDVEFEKTDSDE